MVASLNLKRLKVDRPPQPRTGDKEVDRALYQLWESLAAIAAASFRPVLFADIELPDGETVVIEHGLGHRLRGYIVVRQIGATAAGYLNEVPGTAEQEQTQLSLQANDYGATITVALLVF